MRPRGPHLLLFLAVGLVACGGNDNGLISGPSGSLVVRITDAPFSDAQAVLITFSEVSAQRDNGGFERLAFASGGQSRNCDMKKLYGGKMDVLAQGALPAGHYAGMRFRISGGTLFFDNPTVLPACANEARAPRGSSASLDLADSEAITLRDFNVKAGATTTITVDFAGPESIHGSLNGGFVLQPVIRVDSVVEP